MRFETIGFVFSQTFFQTDLIPSLVELGLCFEHENDKESFKDSEISKMACCLEPIVKISLLF